MHEYAWLLAGGAAVTGVLTTCWQYFKTLYYWAKSWLFVTADMHQFQSEIFIQYLTEQFTSTPYGPRSFLTWWMALPRMRRVLPVLFSVPPAAGTVYWRGWRPIWLQQKNAQDGPEAAPHSNDSNITKKIGASIAFLRGTFDLDQLMIDSVNALKVTNSGKSRFYVKRLFGQRGQYISKDRAQGTEPRSGTLFSRTQSSATTFPGKPMNYTLDDIQPIALEDRAGFRGLVFDEKTQELADFVKGWLHEEAWYHEHMIAWKVGIGLHGLPGCGKTSFARALGEELDMPIIAIALTTCTDEDFELNWAYALGNGPCIVLLEDIDNAYDGRKPRHEDQVGFDLLLNCIDGAATSDGIVVIITTNCIDKLDPALCRPGRIDRMIELKPPTDENRMKLCRRFLDDESLLERVHAKLAGQTGATIVQYCSRLSLQLKWGHPVAELPDVREFMTDQTTPAAIPEPAVSKPLPEVIQETKRLAQEDLDKICGRKSQSFIDRIAAVSDNEPFEYPHNDRTFARMQTVEDVNFIRAVNDPVCSPPIVGG